MNKMKASIRKMFGGRFRAGSYSAFAAVIVIAIAVVANLIVSTLPASMTQLDLTANALYSISDQTRQIAASINQDVTMYLICNNGNEDTTIHRLLQQYEGLNHRITAQLIDPTYDPAFLEKYDLSLNTLYENSVLVDCGGRTRLVSYNDIYVTDYSIDYSTYNYTTTTSFDGENALTNALHYVASESLPKAYILTGHGEAEVGTSIETMLEQDNFEHEELSLLSLDAVPEDATAIIINAPETDLSEDEANLLISYLENGGNVVLTTGYMTADAMPQLKRVTAAMGLAAGEGVIIEADGKMRLSRYPYYLLPDVSSHEVTDALIDSGYYILVPLAQPLTETEDSTATITWLLGTSESAYAKMDALNMTTTDKEDGDSDGPFYIGAVSEKNGKLFWVTSSSLIDSYVDSTVSGANSNLFLNALNWMGGQEESISIRAKSLDTSGLTLTESESSTWSAIMIGVIPVSLIAVGLIIWIRRKRR